MADLSLYFIAIIPPEPIRKYAQELKEYFAANYNSKAALKSPPHITLHMPFKWKEEKEHKLIEALDLIPPQNQPFELTLENFGAFEPRVIYMGVEKSPELVYLYKSINEVMKKELHIFNADYKNRGYHPHLTLAFRDLKKAVFPEAWKEFENRSYQEKFTVDGFHLLKHNGRNWDEYIKISFS